MLKTFLVQLSRNIKKQPGWVPLVVLCYIGVHFFTEYNPMFRELIDRFEDALVVLVAFIAYQVGDALDKILFDRLSPKSLDTYRSIAQKSLNLDKGYYTVSKSLAERAKKYEGSTIQMFNEAAKLFRSVSVVLFFFGLILAFYQRFIIEVPLLVLTPFFLGCYVFFKALHMKRLYKLTGELVKDKNKYFTYSLGGKVTMFFWDGFLVATATKRSDGLQQTQAAPDTLQEAVRE
jgi:hypothetical protein